LDVISEEVMTDSENRQKRKKSSINDKTVRELGIHFYEHQIEQREENCNKPPTTREGKV
jgi:hypothetical protein